MLTVERLREVLHYDPATGEFTRKIATGPMDRSKPGQPCTANDGDGYLVAGIDGVRYRLNRLAWLYMTGEWPAGEVDHKDTVRDNNRWENLRDLSLGVNQQNLRGPRRDNKVGLLGVSERRGRFRAQIKCDGKVKNLGTFDTPMQAHEVYVAEKRRIHPGNTL